MFPVTGFNPMAAALAIPAQQQGAVTPVNDAGDVIDVNSGRKKRLLAAALMNTPRQRIPTPLGGLAEGLQRGYGIALAQKADDADEAARQQMAQRLKQNEEFKDIPVDALSMEQMGKLMMQQYDPSLDLRRQAMQQEFDLSNRRIGLQQQGLELDRARLNKPDALPADIRTIQWLQSQPPEMQQQYNALFGKESNQSALEQKIDLLKQSGVDENTAIGIASGRFVTSRDPMTGAAMIVDKASGQPVGALTSQPSANALSPQTSVSAQAELPEAALESAEPTGLFKALPLATGVESEAVNIGSNVLGQVDEAFVSNPTVRARQQFNVFKKPLQRAMSVNPSRPLKFDLEQTEKLFSGAGIKAPGVVKEELGVLRESIEADLKTSQENAKDNALPTKFRQDEAARVKLLEQALRQLGSPGKKEAKGFEGFSIVE